MLEAMQNESSQALTKPRHQDSTNETNNLDGNFIQSELAKPLHYRETNLRGLESFGQSDSMSHTQMLDQDFFHKPAFSTMFEQSLPGDFEACGKIDELDNMNMAPSETPSEDRSRLYHPDATTIGSGSQEIPIDPLLGV